MKPSYKKYEKMFCQKVTGITVDEKAEIEAYFNDKLKEIIERRRELYEVHMKNKKIHSKNRKRLDGWYWRTKKPSKKKTPQAAEWFTKVKGM